MRSFKTLIVPVVAALALGLAACSSDTGDTGSGGDGQSVDKVTIDLTSMTGANEIAKVGGFFEEQFEPLGISVEYAQLNTSSQILEGIASGNLDFADLGYSGIPTGGAADVDFTIIGQASSGGGDAILATPASGITDVAGLAGATVATSKGSSSWALLVRALNENNLSIDDLTLLDLKPDEAQNAFLTGQVDAWAIWTGSMTDDVNETNSVSVLTGEELGLIPGAIVTRTDLAQNTEVIAAFLTARNQAIEWLETDPEAVAAAVAEDRGVDAELFSSFVTLSAPVNAPISDQVREDYQQTADLFFQIGEVSSEIDVAALIDNSHFEALNG